MRIILAIDGSDCSIAAINNVNEMQFPVGAELKVISAVDFSEPLPVIEEVQKRVRTKAQTLVNQVVRELKSNHPDADISGEVVFGYAVDEVLKVSREWTSDLIIVGSHGRAGFRNVMLGSVARAVLLHAPCAVRIVRIGALATSIPDLHHVLIAVDESEHSAHLIDHVLSLPWSKGTKFRCVSVVRKVDDDVFFDLDSNLTKTIAEHQDDLLRNHKTWAMNAARRINRVYQQEIAFADVLVGDPVEKILELSSAWPADMIMLGSHGRRGIDKLIMGSVSEGVALRADCSVEVSRVPAFRSKGMKYLLSA